MSLFRTLPTPGDFAPLFRLLDDYDTHRSSHGQHSSSIRGFAPRFDVREGEDAYHLDGELPGIAQKDIDIEFSDAQTLVIKGRVEREYHAEPAAESSTATSTDQQQQPPKDDSTSKEVAKTGDNKQVAKSSEQNHRFWVSERSVGEFHRSFTFPTRVDQDRVKASLKNGILSVVVPKATAPAAKKISIE